MQPLPPNKQPLFKSQTIIQKKTGQKFTAIKIDRLFELILAPLASRQRAVVMRLNLFDERLGTG